MDIQIMYDREHGYTATIASLGIVTQGDTFDELVSMVQDALDCYYEGQTYSINIPLPAPQTRLLLGRHFHHATELQSR